MKTVKIILVVIITLFLTGVVRSYFQLKDRHSGYAVDLHRKVKGAFPLQAGFAALSITPEVTDTWTDFNGDAQYDTNDGDSFQDVNGNGYFDAIWLAGFQNTRPAQGIHDPLWARAMVIDDGETRLALVALDAIGFSNDEVIAVRKRVSENAGVDYVIVTATHTHEAPDLLGLWGKSDFQSGVDPEYRELVVAQAAQAVFQAVENRRPAHFRFAQDLNGAESLVGDTREPEVKDPGIRLMQAVDAEHGATLGTLAVWANHPETLWSDNLFVTSDFPHFFREGLEKGVYHGDSLVMEGLGGITVYVNGAIGGLMTTHPSMPISNPFTGEVYQEPSFEKAEAQGNTLALLSLKALEDSSALLTEGSIGLRAKSVELPLDNQMFRLAALLGVLDRGTTSWMQVRSEVSAWTLGPASFLHLPGEIYPELINGGVEAPEGQDFTLQPLENIPLRSAMPGQFRFIVGLSNDMIGYVIPKSQWDTKPPFTYGRKSAPYGEIVSLGPETAPLLHQETLEILTQLTPATATATALEP